MIDVINAYCEKYDEVVVITGRIRPALRNIHPMVKIDQIIPYNRNTILRRLLSWCIGGSQIFFKILFKYRKYEVLYSTNPPTAFFSGLLNNNFSILVYDLYPDALRNIGIKEKNPIFKIWKNLNKKIFKKSHKIITLSEGMKKGCEQYVDSSKIKVIPNWPISEDFKPISKIQNSFIKENELEGKFIILYSGNMGYTHSVEVLVDVAEKLVKEPNILFLIIGEGFKKVFIQNLVRERGLEKFFKFLDFQPIEKLNQSLSSADIGVVSVSEDTALVSVPSKTYNLLSLGKPLLAIAPKASELTHLIGKYDNGVSLDRSQVQEMADYILKCKENQSFYKTLHINSLNASKDFTYLNAREYCS